MSEHAKKCAKYIIIINIYLKVKIPKTIIFGNQTSCSQLKHYKINGLHMVDDKITRQLQPYTTIIYFIYFIVFMQLR